MNIQNKPTIYEINAPIFLNEIAIREQRAVTFASVPESEWDALAEQGIDAVWFMGVWKRSPVARDMAKGEPWLKAALPDARDEDLLGSAYSIQDYSVDDVLGGNEGLAIARAELEKRGIGLVLDYVPNHVAIDHSWATEHPEYLLQGTAEELEKAPSAFIQVGDTVFAKAKDPNFEPWSDVLQINAFSAELRQEVIRTLQTIAGMCDGVRCDMAMLMMNTIFTGTWGSRACAVPDTDYWPQIISGVRSVSPDFLFLAEVYWNKEEALLDQGFDLCYDKKLYDYLLEGTAHDINKHIHQPVLYQNHLLRFIENHDEDRAASVYSFDKHTAAAVVMATLPGAHMYHEGEREGRKSHVPVHLGRRVDEVTDEALKDFYTKLWAFTAAHPFTQAKWKPLKVSSGVLHRESHSLLGWSWTTETSCFIVCINYSAEAAHGRIPLERKEVIGATQIIDGAIEPSKFLHGSRIKLDAWQHVIIEVEK